MTAKQNTMTVDVLDLRQVLKQKQQWVVPIYQRHYEWQTSKDKQIPKLWDDIEFNAQKLLQQEDPLPHYCGALIYAKPDHKNDKEITECILVDGQQRITTFQIVLIAIKDIARMKHHHHLVEQIDDCLFNEISNNMSSTDKERFKFKLWPSFFDRKLFTDITNIPFEGIVENHKLEFFKKNGDIIKKYAPKLLLAYAHIRKEIEKFADSHEEDHETKLTALLDGFLDYFQIVLIQLGEKDDAQEIFASLNGLSEPLSQFDLIRNDIFHRANKKGEDAEELFARQWHHFEKSDSLWSQKSKQGPGIHSDIFIEHVVIAEIAKNINMKKIATEYRHYARKRKFETVEAELTLLNRHAKNYKLLQQPQNNPALQRIIFILHNTSRSKVFSRLILWVLNYVIDEDEQKEIFRLLERYIIRRAICDLPGKYYNHITIHFLREIKNPPRTHYQAFRQCIIKITDHEIGNTRRMPSDAEVKRAVLEKSVYCNIQTNCLRYILQQINNTLNNSLTDLKGCTIEHIMPQFWHENWPLSNGQNASRSTVEQAIAAGSNYHANTYNLINERERVVDTLGNLTLNSSSQNPPSKSSGWQDKKKEFSKPPLALNKMLIEIEHWDVDSIKARSEQLADIIIKLWPIPQS